VSRLVVANGIFKVFGAMIEKSTTSEVGLEENLDMHAEQEHLNYKKYKSKTHFCHVWKHNTLGFQGRGHLVFISKLVYGSTSSVQVCSCIAGH